MKYFSYKGGYGGCIATDALFKEELACAYLFVDRQFYLIIILLLKTVSHSSKELKVF